MPEIELTGLDGGNLLGFLAAVGVLRTLAQIPSEPAATLHWVESSRWMPVIAHPSAETPEQLLGMLAIRLCGEASVNPAWQLSPDLTMTCEEWRAALGSFARDAAANRGVLDFLAAFGSEAYGSGPKKITMSDTAFRTMSGAGHQHFLGFMSELASQTTEQHLRRALLEPWDYGDARPSLRWDPADFRPHALRAEDPSDDPIRTMRGANRLAIEALPLFPALPVRRKVRTVGFSDRKRETGVSWPIWTDPLDCRSVGAALASAEIQKPDASVLRRRGIAQVFYSIRFTEGKFRNFSPSRPLI